MNKVRVRREPVVFPTYEPDAPDKNPMFLEKRVYQGSSGRVYPLPFFNRIAEEPTEREWDAIYLDNGFVEVMLLPEIGGRVHAIRDLTNGYDSIYRQHVIKPALVGLGGPWASGGIEFNWPQHHRPSTFMPKDVAIEEAEDGSVTVWMGEHEPMDRTKGMIGICLHPERSVVEIKARLYNRTPYVQTFLYWANIGTHVHEAYKSFFPPDAHTVADHAKRALSSYPLATDHYYGVDYGERGRDGIPEDEKPRMFVPKHAGGEGPDYAPNDISWYANIPVPTSYMCVGTEQDFVGGYDYFKQAGLLHVADHHIAPGKKQWTWGNQEFGYAWDRNLTESDGPYIELMAGIYTDNQPDFSYIMPGETRTFSHFLYPYQSIGAVHYANVDAAISVEQGRIAVAVTRAVEGYVKAVRSDGTSQTWSVALAPDKPFVQDFDGAVEVELGETNPEPLSHPGRRGVGERGSGGAIARYELVETPPAELQPATEPLLPADVASSDELFIIGQHLEQYRHATRSAADYWREALRRDAGDVRCNNGLGLWHFKRGEFELAKTYFEAAIKRATSRNPNPYDGEPYYNLGLTLRFLGRDKEAFDAFAKSTWNAAWQAPAYHALGELACRRGDWTKAVEYLDRAIRKDQDNFRARNLRSMIVDSPTARAESQQLDPLDFWAQWLNGVSIQIDNQTRFDLVIDLMRAGLTRAALEMLKGADRNAGDGTAPMVGYYEGFLLTRLGSDATDAYAKAKAAPTDYCFPARLEDIAILEAAPADDGQAAYYLGNLMYDRQRYDEAIELWEQASELEPSNSITLRNLGIAAFNVQHDADKARDLYGRAIAAAPDEGRLWYERDQLWKRIGVSPQDRLSELSRRKDLVANRDDLTIEYCSLLNAVDKPDEAAEMLEKKVFQPWEGGEGLALGIFSRTQMALAANDSSNALGYLERAINPPYNLGEARHILANASDVWLAYGDAHHAAGKPNEAAKWWNKAANFKGDFQGMAVQPFSELTYFQILALERLGRYEESRALLDRLETYAQEESTAIAKIDYFATSLPTMLLFEDDIQERQQNRARFIQAQVAMARGNRDGARSMLTIVLSVDPNHAMASDLLKQIH